jgi:hypothetical protein
MEVRRGVEILEAIQATRDDNRTLGIELQTAYKRLETMEARRGVEILEAIQAAGDNNSPRKCEGMPIIDLA